VVKRRSLSNIRCWDMWQGCISGDSIPMSNAIRGMHKAIFPFIIHRLKKGFWNIHNTWLRLKWHIRRRKWLWKCWLPTQVQVISQHEMIKLIRFNIKMDWKSYLLISSFLLDHIRSFSSLYTIFSDAPAEKYHLCHFIKSINILK